MGKYGNWLNKGVFPQCLGYTISKFSINLCPSGYYQAKIYILTTFTLKRQSYGLERKHLHFC